MLHLLSCIAYRNNIYVAFATSKVEWMITVYNPMNDVWNNVNRNYKLVNYQGRLIIANDRLFFAQVCYPRTYAFVYKFISIFEIKIKDRLLIPITHIIQLEDMQYNKDSSSHCIFGIGNKITIVGYMKGFVITFDVSTNEQEEIGYNDIESIWNHTRIYPPKYTLISP